MTTQSPAGQANLRKFQDLLRDLFQFEAPSPPSTSSRLEGSPEPTLEP